VATLFEAMDAGIRARVQNSHTEGISGFQGELEKRIVSQIIEISTF